MRQHLKYLKDLQELVDALPQLQGQIVKSLFLGDSRMEDGFLAKQGVVDGSELLICYDVAHEADCFLYMKNRNFLLCILFVDVNLLCYLSVLRVC